MTALLLTVLVLHQAPIDETLVYHFTFGSYLKKVAPMPEERARENAVSAAGLDARAERIIGLFAPAEDVPGQLGDVRLALRHKGRWLVVDNNGVARLGAVKGRFDVREFERLKRREQALRDLAPSILVSIELHNETDQNLTLHDASGMEVARVEPRARVQTETWYAQHELRLDGRLVGLLERDLEESRTILERDRVAVLLETVRGPRSTREWTKVDPRGRVIRVIVRTGGTG
jgi:hypothetical protein